MRMAVITRPEGGVAEATKFTGEATVAPFAGEETVIPPVELVDTGVTELPTVMLMELLKTVPAVFHACTMTEWPPAGTATEVSRVALFVEKFVLLKVYMLWPST